MTQESTQSRSERTAAKKKKSKWKKILLFIVSVLLLAVVAIVIKYGVAINSFVNDISVSDNSVEQTEADLLLDEKKPVSFLLLGMDLDDNLTSRTDTIMVATVNPDSKDMKLVSMPRDTLVTTDFGFTEKINAMYTFGGIELMMTEVEKLLDIPLEHYAILNFEGLAELVNAVGGIQVYSDFAFKESNSINPGHTIEIKEGLQHLNGEEALGFARMRKSDPRGDFGRQERQQKVIEALLKEMLSLNILSNFTPILDAISPYLQTNLSGTQMLTLAVNYSDSVGDMETLEITGGDSTEYFPHYGLNVYTFIPHEESLAEVSAELQEHLGIRSRSSRSDDLQSESDIDDELEENDVDGVELEDDVDAENSDDYDSYNNDSDTESDNY